jgi:hypothetical protein
MRYIALHDKQPSAEWLTKADRVIHQVKNAPNSIERNKIIESNRKIWGELKQWLLSLSHDKCWFSEARDCINYSEVEHFRPKTIAKDKNGRKHEGYWWLAFDWENYRICGDVVNKKKGTFFPLREGCVRASPFGDYRLEEAILLDPADPNDPVLLSFDFDGNAIPAAGVTDEWDLERVSYSIKRYNLNTYSLLVDQRKLVWTECWNAFLEYKAELKKYDKTRSPIAMQKVKDAAQKIRSMLKEDREFSSVAHACLISSGDPRAAGILRSV